MSLMPDFSFTLEFFLLELAFKESLYGSVAGKYI